VKMQPAQRVRYAWLGQYEKMLEFLRERVVDPIQIAAILSGFSSVAVWPAALKSRARRVTANLPLAARSISCDILACCAA
jgi:hypothetical protein